MQDGRGSLERVPDFASVARFRIVRGCVLHGILGNLLRCPHPPEDADWEAADDGSDSTLRHISMSPEGAEPPDAKKIVDAYEQYHPEVRGHYCRRDLEAIVVMTLTKLAERSPLPSQPCSVDTAGVIRHTGTCSACKGAIAVPIPSAANEMLQNLLAVIHRDGGHYVAEHGLEKASADAEKIVANFNAALPSPGAQPPSDETDYYWKDGALKWGHPHDVGHLILQLQTLDPKMKVSSVTFIDMKDGRKARAYGLSMSRERWDESGWLNFKLPGPECLAIWSNPREEVNGIAAERTSAAAPGTSEDHAKELADLLCPPHANLDKNNHLEPFDNCIACIRNERDELRQLLLRISTDIGQTIIEDPIKSADGWTLLSKPVLADIAAVFEMKPIQSERAAAPAEVPKK